MNTYYTIPIGRRQTVNPQEVMLLQAEVNYTLLYFVDDKKIVVATPLKKLESRFVEHTVAL